MFCFETLGFRLALLVWPLQVSLEMLPVTRVWFQGAVSQYFWEGAPIKCNFCCACEDRTCSPVLRCTWHKPYLSSLKDKNHNPFSKDFVKAIVFMQVKIIMKWIPSSWGKYWGRGGFQKRFWLSWMPSVSHLKMLRRLEFRSTEWFTSSALIINSLILWLYLAVTCAVMQKSGAGLHTASSCFWDTTTDGNFPHSD